MPRHLPVVSTVQYRIARARCAVVAVVRGASYFLIRIRGSCILYYTVLIFIMYYTVFCIVIPWGCVAQHPIY